MAAPQYKIKNLWLQAGESYYAYTVHLHKAEVLDLAGDWQESLATLDDNYDFAPESRSQETGSRFRNKTDPAAPVYGQEQRFSCAP